MCLSLEPYFLLKGGTSLRTDQITAFLVARNSLFCSHVHTHTHIYSKYTRCTYYMVVYTIYSNNGICYSIYYLVCVDVNQHVKYSWQNDNLGCVTIFIANSTKIIIFVCALFLYFKQSVFPFSVELPVAWGDITAQPSAAIRWWNDSTVARFHCFLGQGNKSSILRM